MLVANGRDHGFAHTVGGMQAKFFPSLIEL